MVLTIRTALDTIKPDDDLVFKTELMLREKAHGNKPLLNINPLISKLSLTACLVLIVGSMIVSGYGYYQHPVNYLDIDINPSLELEINRFDRVVRVNYFNKDAENLIDEKLLRGCNPEEAVTLVLEAASESGYISEGKTSVVSLASIGSVEGGSDSMLEKCSDTIKSQYEDVAVFSSTVSSELKEEADSALMSAGKMNLIKMLQVLDETATVEEYKDDSVNAIIEKLNALASNSNNEGSENKKNSVQNGIHDVTEQMKRIEEKLNKGGNKPSKPQNSNKSEQASGNKSDNKAESQNSSSKNAPTSGDLASANKPITPQKSQDKAPEKEIEDLPSNEQPKFAGESKNAEPPQNAEKPKNDGQPQDEEQSKPGT